MSDTEIVLLIRPDQMSRLRTLARGRGVDKLVQSIVDRWLALYPQAERAATDACCEEEAKATREPHAHMNYYDGGLLDADR